MVTLTDAELIDEATRAGLCIAGCWNLEPNSDDEMAQQKLAALRTFADIVSARVATDIVNALVVGLRDPHGREQQEVA